MKLANTELSYKPRLMLNFTPLLNIISGSPDDQDGSGGLVVGGSEHYSDCSGLPRLQQQTQDTFSNQVLLALACLQNKKRGRIEWMGRGRNMYLYLKN